MMAQRKLSVWTQIREMQRQWPSFTLLERKRHLARWDGIIRPYEQEYRVQVLLKVPRTSHDQPQVQVPKVTVINPKLRARREDSSSPIPHIYPNKATPDLPVLCLYDPAKNEWGYDRSVARTIIPWTIDWLVCYEGWLATGQWTGGGRH